MGEAEAGCLGTWSVCCVLLDVGAALESGRGGREGGKEGENGGKEGRGVEREGEGG